MIKYFNSLTPEELQKFEDFINSPYFNKNKKNIEVFKYLKSQYPYLQNIHTKKAALFKEIYKNEKYSEKKAWKLVAEFNSLFKNFMLQTEHERNTTYNNLLLLTSLNRKALEKEYLHSRKEIIEYFEEQFLKDDDYYYTYQNINYEDYNFNSEDLKGKFPGPLEKRSDNLDYFYVFSKLHTFRDMLMHEYISGKKFKLNRRFSKEILSFIEKNTEEIKQNHPNIYIVYLSLIMESSPDNSRFASSFITYLAENNEKIPVEKLKYYYNYLISFYTTKVNKGEIAFRENLLELLKIMDMYGIFVVANYIKEDDFNRAIITALTMGDYSWAEYFINKYEKHLQDETRESIVSLSRAKLFFYRKDYSHAQEKLQEITEQSPLYYINSRILEIKISYELRDYVRIDYLLENLRRYVERNKSVRETDRINNKKFLFYTKELIKLNDKKKDAIVLRKQLDKEESFIPDKYWLYGKIQEIEKPAK